MELSKRFDFKTVDEKWARYWEEEDLFHAEPDPSKKPYVITIPPPNVTGILHMGHALNNTLQDIIVRYKRMNGFVTCWMPGTDHAGIATQNVVEKTLKDEGTDRHAVGREQLLERLWAWKKEYGDTIINQLKKLGASCDWPRTSFTMDEDYSLAVRTVFVHLYEKGLIYRGEYIINWCPRCHTALSDEEAEHKETQGQLYHIRYPFKDDPSKHLVVATTRPETMLGDTAVAVSPKDPRYQKVVGKTLMLPLMNREIPVVRDAFVDPEFGTGAVKVTPAHDPNDFEIGKRHDLAFINILNDDATLNDNAGAFKGMDRFKARKKVVNALQEKELLEKVEPHAHAVGHCYRCHTVVEPYLSKQWFVKMAPLAKPALKVVKKGKITFHPKRWTKVYTNWMENIRDWCISRQIWWGHRIPVWYCVGDGKCDLKCREPIVSMDTPQKCPHCGSKNLKQDEDVLDTWFSSWLWPFATFGWPKENEDLKYFYPGDALFTASEIIFFWVARMIMAGLEFQKDIPFRQVYIHGTVRDTKGRKMSKSLGNAIDPLEIINEYGADALRFSLIMNSGQDLYISKEKFETGRNFANKIWNASRLILMNTPDTETSFEFKDLDGLDLPSKWIISRFYGTLEKVGQSVEEFRFSEAENLIYEFFWNNFCDWYLEIVKDRWGESNIQKVALKVLEQSIVMMHPFIPFVTEELWSQIHPGRGKALCVSAWPGADRALHDPDAEKQMSIVIDVVSAVRNLRAEWNIKPTKKIPCHLSARPEQTAGLLQENSGIIKKLAGIDRLEFEHKPQRHKNSATAVVGAVSCAVPLGDLIDLDKERRRINKQITEQETTVAQLTKRLKNKNFVNKAPKEVVEKEEERLRSVGTKLQQLKETIARLQ